MSEQPKLKKCSHCDEGMVVCETGDHTCGNCEQGSIWSPTKEDWVECPECDGPGSIACDEKGCDGSERECEHCHGEGFIEVV